jgi:hypothetical protein
MSRKDDLNLSYFILVILGAGLIASSVGSFFTAIFWLFIIASLLGLIRQ